MKAKALDRPALDFSSVTADGDTQKAFKQNGFVHLRIQWRRRNQLIARRGPRRKKKDACRP